MESNLHYNYFKDYDPNTGRYVQSDPIGLRGGDNTYIYALGNPLIFRDYNGLMARVCCRKIPGLPAVHCFVQVKNGGSYSDGRQCLQCPPVQEARYGLQGPPPFGSSEHSEAGRIHINDPFDAPNKSDCGSWNEECDTNSCVVNIVNSYSNPSMYNAIFGPNSNTFAGTIARACNLKEPDTSWLAPGWYNSPAPPYQHVPHGWGDK